MDRCQTLAVLDSPLFVSFWIQNQGRRYFLSVANRLHMASHSSSDIQTGCWGNFEKHDAFIETSVVCSGEVCIKIRIVKLE